ncbi:MAG TPA: hypothetical protein VEW28_05670 [Candidatus Kapabacteria bacterium]|nr:hypothetical protein [Candidatus Kapabacteria bacterium]
MLLCLTFISATLLGSSPADSGRVHMPLTAPVTAPAADTLYTIGNDFSDRLIIPTDSLSSESIVHNKLHHVSTPDNVSHDTSKYIPQEQFTWAGRERFILDGSEPLRVTQIKPATLYGLEGTYLGVLVALHIYQENTFWRQSTSFRVRDNWDESLGANYGGHFVAGYFVSYISTEFLLASGVSTKLAPIYGSLMGLGYQTYVEVLDGYGIDFELSPYETYAQTLGVVYYLASQYSPLLQNFIPKFNYYPSAWYHQLPKNGSQTPIDDYSAWNFWMSVNIPNLTGGALKPVWPDWLHLAVGYGARNLGDPGESRIVTLALDYDLVKLLPDGSPTWNWFKQTLNFFKFPSPTIEWRFSRDGWKNMGTRFYLLYPFQIGNISF